MKAGNRKSPTATSAAHSPPSGSTGVKNTSKSTKNTSSSSPSCKSQTACPPTHERPSERVTSVRVTNIEFEENFCEMMSRGLLRHVPPGQQIRNCTAKQRAGTAAPSAPAVAVKQHLSQAAAASTAPVPPSARPTTPELPSAATSDGYGRRMSGSERGATSSVDSRPVLRRHPHQRIFVNRSLYLEKIKFFGFDMDYTLAEYTSPLFESICFDLIKDRLVSVGYPREIKQLYEYDPSFPVRGLWFDSLYGTLLKVDPYGNILVAMLGFKVLEPAQVVSLYPTQFVHYDEERFNVLNTLFAMPELYCLACLVHYFTSNQDYLYLEPTGVVCRSLFMSFNAIKQDVRDAVDYIHLQSTLKEVTMARLPELVHKDHRLPMLLDRMRCHGAKTFLLTNSKFDYTDKMMGYLLNQEENSPEQLAAGATPARKWTSYFDYVVVDANKPKFFSEGSTLREIDPVTNEQSIGTYTGPLKSGQVYAGGSCDVFSSLIGASGKDVLYIGDHIVGDILKSKKIRGWRTFLVVPELIKELYIWTTRHEMYDRLHEFENELNKQYVSMDLASTTAPDTGDIKQQIRNLTHELDLQYGLFGSIFKSGGRQTYFCSQVLRYADLYSGTFLNLLHYPFCYLFRAPPMLMPHESTVDQYGIHQFPEEIRYQFEKYARSSFKENDSKSRFHGGVAVHRQSLIAATPKTITHHHDDDSDDAVVAGDIPTLAPALETALSGMAVEFASSGHSASQPDHRNNNGAKDSRSQAVNQDGDVAESAHPKVRVDYGIHV